MLKSMRDGKERNKNTRKKETAKVTTMPLGSGRPMTHAYVEDASGPTDPCPSLPPSPSRPSLPAAFTYCMLHAPLLTASHFSLFLLLTPKVPVAAARSSCLFIIAMWWGTQTCIHVRCAAGAVVRRERKARRRELDDGAAAAAWLAVLPQRLSFFLAGV